MNKIIKISKIMSVTSGGLLLVNSGLVFWGANFNIGNIMLLGLAIALILFGIFFTKLKKWIKNLLFYSQIRFIF